MPRKIKGFSRVESEDARGWLVRIKRGDIKRSRFVSDSSHGGKRKAQQEAQRIYAEWVKELPAPDTAEDKIGARNTSGVVGVHYSYDVDERYPNCAYEYYIASWKTKDGRRQNIRFAISKWGKKAAFELACIAREKRINDRDKIQAIYERQKGGKKKATPKTARKKVSPTKKKSTKKKVAKKTVKKAGIKSAKKKKSAARKKTAKKSARRR